MRKTKRVLDTAEKQILLLKPKGWKGCELPKEIGLCAIFASGRGQFMSTEDYQ